MFTPSITAAKPNAGQILQQIETEQIETLPDEKIPAVIPTEKVIDKKSGPTVTVSKFLLQGNTLISNDTLEVSLEAYLNRPLGFVELKQAAVDIAQIYRDQGWIVRTFIPQQDFVDGQVSIQVIEAIFGEVRTEGVEPTLYSQTEVLKYITAFQKKGEQIDANKLDRALLLTNDLPGIAVTGGLARGKGQNETDFVLKISDDKRYFGDIALDNTGSYSTGSERLQANIDVNSPLRIADRLSTSVIFSEGMNYLRLGYSIPVGYNGLRLSFSSSLMDYEIVEGDFVDLELQGDSFTAGLGATYPLIRSRYKNLYLAANLEHKDFLNKSGSNVTTDYTIDNLSLRLYGNLFDAFSGGGANSFSLSLQSGKVDLGTHDNRVGEQAEVDGNFYKLNYSLSRQQVITDTVSLYASIFGQQASDSIDSAERFYIGGYSGVRAYPANEGGGADGHLAKIEMRWRLPKGFVVSGFYDYGHVSGRDSLPSNYSLDGVGISVDWATKIGVNLNMVLSRRLGDNPNLTASGHDQDGTLDRNRIWLNAVMAF